MLEARVCQGTQVVLLQIRVSYMSSQVAAGRVGMACSWHFAVQVQWGAGSIVFMWIHYTLLDIILNCETGHLGSLSACQGLHHGITISETQSSWALTQRLGLPRNLWRWSPEHLGSSVESSLERSCKLLSCHILYICSQCSRSCWWKRQHTSHVKGFAIGDRKSGSVPD